MKSFTGFISERYSAVDCLTASGEDNIMIERFWRTLKYEDIYLKDYETVGELIAGLREYFLYYNNARSYQSLDGRTPAEVYNGISLKGAA